MLWYPDKITGYRASGYQILTVLKDIFSCFTQTPQLINNESVKTRNYDQKSPLTLNSGQIFSHQIWVCHEVEVTPYLELLITFGMSLEGVCHDPLCNFTTSLYLIWRWLKIIRKKLSSNWVWESYEFGVRWSLTKNLPSEGKFLVSYYEFGGSFGMSL